MITLTGIMKDGRPIKVLYEFKGDMIPGYDKDGNRFEAVTAWYRILENSEAAVEAWLKYERTGLTPFNPSKPIDRGEMPWMIEGYIQIDNTFQHRRNDEQRPALYAAFRKRLQDDDVEIASLVQVSDDDVPVPLQPGDIVKLRSGSPNMTIITIDGEANLVAPVLVSWFDGHRRIDDRFPLSSLDRVKP